MGLFSFKKSEEPAVKSFDDLFTFKFADVPDSTFIETKEKNAQDEEISVYRKILPHKECGIFDTIEVLLIGEKQKNIVLTTTDINKISVSDVKKIVDTVFLFLGNDTDYKGRFDNDDKKDIEKGFYWSRMWTGDNAPFHCMITLSPPTFEMSLLSVQNVK